MSVQFVAFFIQSIRKHLESHAPATAQKNINNDTLRQLAVPLPPIDEQAEIVTQVEDKLSIIEATEKAIDAQTKRSARLRQSILKRAFEGKLVPQDPTDEPASVLLERIRAEREASSGKRMLHSIRRKSEGNS